ncbi:MAG: hypothetical protein ACRC33_22335 [Gemmataceae bacterium]
MKKWTAVGLTCLVAFLALNAGCGDRAGKLKTVPVSGKLFSRGKPAAGALVIFNPPSQADEKDPIYPKGTVKDDGSFRLTTYAQDDGAPEGEYSVTVLWQGTRAGGEGGGADKLGGRYADPRSPRLKATVRAGKLEPEQFNAD